MTRPPVQRRRILLAMIEAGGGHRAPALALQAAIQRLYPERFEVDVFDIMAEVGDSRLDQQHKQSWRWMLAHPRVTYLLQSIVDRAVPIRLTRWAQARLLAPFSRHLAAFVRERGYQLVVGVHFMPLQAAAMARRRGELDVRLVGVNSDPFDGHALWAEPHADELIVASEQSRDLLAAKGVPAGRIRILGYPLSLAYVDADRDAEAARRRLGLHSGALTVLHTTGGEGIGGDVEGTVAAVLAADLPLQYVVIAGRNERLRARLEGLAEARAGKPGRTSLRVEGFTNAMPDFIAASDLVLAKAGAASTFEALALGRPIFHTSYVAPNEKRNLDYCRDHGIGGYVPRPRDVVALLAPLTRDPAPLRAWQAAVADLGLTPGTLAIAAHLAELADAS